MKWSTEDIAFVLENLSSKTIEEIALLTGHSVMSVTLFLHRRRLAVGKTVEHNLCRRILQKKFPDVNCFQPTRTFYNAVKISQKRFWDIYLGRKQMSDVEYAALSKYLGLSYDESLMARQLNLFEND